MSVVDACVWISAMLPSQPFHDVSARWIESCRDGGTRTLVAPGLVLAEVSGAVARQTGDVHLAETCVQRLLDLDDLELADMDRDLCTRAARHASRLRLRRADAIYVAVAAALGLPLVTWDRELAERASAVVGVEEPNA